MKVLKYVLLAAIVVVGLLFAFRKNFGVNPPIKVSSSKYDSDLPLEKLTLPEGFQIDVYAENVVNARSLSLSPSGTLFVGTRSEGNVYALQDTDEDGKVDKQFTLLKEGNMPNGVAFKDGDLYIAEVNRILKFENIETKLEDPGKPVVVYDKYPTESHHGWKYIAFGPDDRLYVPVGAPCNMCDPDEEIFCTITSMNKDGSDMRIEQDGIRNTVGFGWHPMTKELYFTDNGRDMMGDNKPDCELNVAQEKGMHFGYPYCHQGDILDPEYGKGKNCDDYVKPIVKMGPHTAPLGLEFNAGINFPEEYKNDILVARHGSWNRSEKIGYDIVRIHQNPDGSYERSPFITGWLENEDVWGRPVDLEMMPDGSFLISDDYADVIYRVRYKG